MHVCDNSVVKISAYEFLVIRKNDEILWGQSRKDRSLRSPSSATVQSQKN